MHKQNNIPAGIAITHIIEDIFTLGSMAAADSIRAHKSHTDSDIKNFISMLIRKLNNSYDHLEPATAFEDFPGVVRVAFEENAGKILDLIIALLDKNKIH
jgi:hypothetical protein